MPLQPGEVSLVTLFTDAHTYLAPPTSRPVHHRFDRRSYIYLFHDALNKRGRVEVANNAGTPDQDAFNGYLDMARVEYSYKQPNLFTITIDSRAQGSPQNDLSQWHLPAFDPRNENKYMYKIHTLELYLWTTDDASLFLDSLKRVLQPQQLAISDVPANLLNEHRNSMSPVVQQLEQAAISGHGHAGRTASVSTTQSFPPPPPNPANGTPTPGQSAQSPPAANFAPMGYNPAAPAAPEQRVHREKTPPPPDADSGTGLAAAAHHDQHPQFAGPPQGGFAPQQASYMPGPPQGGPPHSASPYVQSFAPHPQPTPPSDPNAHLYGQQPGTPGIQRQSSYPYQPGAQPGAPQPQQPQYANYAPTSTSGPGGPASPGMPPQTPSYGAQSFAPTPTQGQPQAQGQPGTYGPASAQGYTQQSPYGTQHSMHQQFYIPEGSNKPAVAGPGSNGQGQKVDPGRFDQKFDRIEKGVGKFLKRLDKKL